MPNQYVNKVVSNNVVKIDLTSDTVTADKLLSGYTAHDASGQIVTGNIQNGDSLGYGVSYSSYVGTARLGALQLGASS